MIDQLKTYPDYRDSGQEWLGTLPSQWSVSPARAVFTEIVERDRPDEQMLSVTIARGVILQGDLLAEGSKKDSSNENKSSYKMVQCGDIVYNKMRAWQGAIGVSELAGIVSPAYIVQRPRRALNTQYFHYLFRTPSFATEAERWSYGITSDQWSLRAEDFKQIYVPIPTRAEQDSIVRFLDHYDSRINRLIRTKRRLIELLNEQKQAIIHQAVTRGLDPNVRLKPSGVEWLGDIPVQWDMRRLKHVAYMKSGESITSNQIDERGKYPVFGGNGLRGYTSNFTHEGDVVLVGRQGALCGNVQYANGRFYASEHAVVCSLKREHNLTWFGELLRTMDLNQYSQAAAQPGLAVERILNLKIPVPARPDQDRIADNIEVETRELDRTINTTLAEIELIREYRTRLIADIVTGKLDVRGVELPELDNIDQFEGFVDEEDTEPEESLDAEEVVHARD